MEHCTLETVDRVDVISFGSPVLSVQVLSELDAALDELSDRTVAVPLVLRSSHPTIFLAGAHLAEIAALDARSCRHYARRGRAVLDRLATLPGPTVAAVHGSCSGGGFDLVLACDRIVAGPAASFGHPGILRGLVTGWGGTVRLPGAAGASLARLAVLAARPLAAEDLARHGVALVSGPDVVGTATAEAARLAAIHPDRLAAWRLLRDRGATTVGSGHRL